MSYGQVLTCKIRLTIRRQLVLTGNTRRCFRALFRRFTRELHQLYRNGDDSTEFDRPQNLRVFGERRHSDAGAGRAYIIQQWSNRRQPADWTGFVASGAPPPNGIPSLCIGSSGTIPDSIYVIFGSDTRSAIPASYQILSPLRLNIIANSASLSLVAAGASCWIRLWLGVLKSN